MRPPRSGTAPRPWTAPPIDLPLGEQRVDDPCPRRRPRRAAARARAPVARSISTDRDVGAARRRPGRTRSARAPVPPASRSSAAAATAEPPIDRRAAGERADARRRSRRCRRCATVTPRRIDARAGRRRSARTASRGPGRSAIEPTATITPVAVARDRRVLVQPARALDAERDAGAGQHVRAGERRVTGGSPGPRAHGRLRLVLRSARARGPGSARSRPSRRSSRARSGSGNARTRLRRRSSTGSMPSCRAAASIVGLDQVGRLGPAGAAVGRGRHLVRARAGDEHLDGRDVVAAGSAASRSCAAGSPCSAAGRRRGRPAAGRAARGSGRRRRARARPRRAARGPAARRAGSRAGPRPTCTGRPSLQRGERDQRRLDRQRALGAEAAADVGHDHADRCPRRGRGICASCARGRCALCDDDQTVSRSPSGAASAPRGSIGAAARRGITCSVRTTCAAARERSRHVARALLPAHQRLARARVDDRLAAARSRPRRARRGPRASARVSPTTAATGWPT